MHLRVGTSGYQYKFWRGSFYAERCKEADMLAEYARQLPTVEINNTFYRLPRREVVARWAAQVPEDFRFSVKASRRITHIKRLREVGEPLEYLMAAVAELGAKQGPVLFQLPPTLRLDRERLAVLLDQVGGRARVALEFRHPSWYEEPVYALLRAHDAALCLSDAGEGEAATPWIATASWGYLRLRRESYPADALSQVVAQLGAQPWSDAYAYFKHEESGASLARSLQQLCPPAP